MANDPAPAHKFDIPEGEPHPKPPGSPRVASWDGTPHRMSLERQKRGFGAGYGTPQEGTKSEARGFRAGHNVSKEICELCENIINIAEPHPDGTFTVQFGPLFKLYTVISEKVVGMLIRARRHKLVTFEGEMLYQKQDDEKVITLIAVPAPLEKQATRIYNHFFGEK